MSSNAWSQFCATLVSIWSGCFDLLRSFRIGGISLYGIFLGFIAVSLLLLVFRHLFSGHSGEK